MSEIVQEALNHPIFGKDKKFRKTIEEYPYPWSKYEPILKEYPDAYFVKAGSSIILLGTRYPRLLEIDKTAIKIDGSHVGLREMYCEVPNNGGSVTFGALKNEPIPLREWIETLKNPKSK